MMCSVSPTAKRSHPKLKNEEFQASEMTSSDTELIARINAQTSKCTKFLHLAESLYGSHRTNSAESGPIVQVPTLFHIHSSHARDVGLCEEKFLQDILRDSKNDVWLFSGPAGSGKTTLLKTIAQNTLNKEYEGLRDVSIVVFLKCGDFGPKKTTSLYQLLLSNVEPEVNKSDLGRFQKMVNEEPSKLLIVLDGLDMLPREFYSQTKNKAKIDLKQSRVSDILDGLLTGMCLPGCRVIASSRDIGIFQKSQDLQNKVFHIQLGGLKDVSIYNIARHYLESIEAEQLMQFLGSHPTLLHLCRTPVFLIATILGRRQHPCFIPSNICETLLYLISRFIRSEHFSVGENEAKACQRFAFDQLKNHTFAFDPEILSKYQASRENLGGLLCDNPGRQNRIVFFIHQLIQEMFAALHVASLKKSAFEIQITNCFSTPQFFNVLQLLGGLLCNAKTLALATNFGLVNEDEEWQDKQGIFHRLLQNALTKFNQGSSGSLNIIHILHQCGPAVEDMINRNLTNIVISVCEPSPLSIRDVHALSHVAASTQSLSSLSLSLCCLELQHMVVLWTVFSQRAKQIKKLNFSHNNLTLPAIKIAGQLAQVCSTEELDVSGCTAIQRDDLALLPLKAGLQSHKLKVLNISYNDKDIREESMTDDIKETRQDYVYKLMDSRQNRQFFIPSEIISSIHLPGTWKAASYDMVRAIEKLMPNVTECIFVHCWKFTEEWKEILRSNMKINAIQNPRIMLSQDCAIQNEQKQPSTWNINKCILKEKNDLDSVILSADVNAKLKVNDTDEINKIDGNGQVSPKEFKIVHRGTCSGDLKMFRGLISQSVSLGEVELRDCGLNKDFLLNLLHEIKSSQNIVQVKKLSITAETRVVELVPIICEIMRTCDTSALNLEESDCSTTIATVLHEYITKSKVRLEMLNLSYMKNIGDFNELGKLISNRVRELHLVNCDLNFAAVKSLQCITDSQIVYLDISFNPEIDDESIQLLPRILNKKKRISLLMQGCELYEYDMDAFISFEDIQIQLLDLSYNDCLEKDGISKVIRHAHKAEELRLSSCNLDRDCIVALTEASHKCKLGKLDLSQNPEIASHAKEIACLMKESTTPVFDLSNCMWTYSQIQNLAAAMNPWGIKLKQIDLSDRMRVCLNQQYMKALIMLSSSIEKNILVCLPKIPEEDINVFSKENGSHWKKIVFYGKRVQCK